MTWFWGIGPDTVGTPVDPLTYITGLGFPGVIIGLFAWGTLRTKGEVDRLIAENTRKDRLIDIKDRQIITMAGAISDKALPALTRSTEILESLPQAEFVEQIRQVRDEISRLQAHLEEIEQWQ